MAVASASASKCSESDQTEKIDNNSKNQTDSPKQQPKRNKSPGVRMINGRIYDSQNGKTCHQCRQKTLDFSADCKNQRKNKPCPLKFCRTCLLNRYGEKAEEMAKLEDWECPKCRGICNCSLCMKKRGHLPTGSLAQTAKACGFASVSELLNVKGPENVGQYKRTKELGTSPRKRGAADEATVVTSSKKRWKENLFDGNTDLNLHPLPSSPHSIIKVERSKDMHASNADVGCLLSDSSLAPASKKQNLKFDELEDTQKDNRSSDHLLEENGSYPYKRTGKEAKPEESTERLDGDVDTGPCLTEAGLNGIQQEKNGFKTSVHEEACSDFSKHEMREVETKGNKIPKVVAGLYPKNYQNQTQDVDAIDFSQADEDALEVPENCVDAANPLPTGSELTSLSGIDMPMADVGNALQFLEFCATFGEVLDLRKEQGEVVLREIINGRSARPGKHSLVVKFHIQLFSVIQEELGSEPPTLNSTNDNNSWLNALKECIPKSENELNALHLDQIDGKVDAYETLDSSTKLRLLNFLCDEVLGTERIRNWIDNQNSQFVEKSKEAKERVAAAKEKEKRLKQKMHDDIAKAVIAKNGASLSILEHEAIVSQNKIKTAEAHAELLECKRMVSEGKKRPNALRTEPILFDRDGRVYWRLGSYSNKHDILLQDVGTGDALVSGEKWHCYDVEEICMIEKHITGLRNGRKRPRILC